MTFSGLDRDLKGSFSAIKLIRKFPKIKYLFRPAPSNRGPRTTPPPHTPHPGPRRGERTKGLGGGGAGAEEEREGVAVGAEGNGGPRGGRHPGFAAAAGATGARLLTGSGCLSLQGWDRRVRPRLV